MKFKVNDNVRICDNHSKVMECRIMDICLAGQDLRKNEFYHNKWTGRKHHAVISAMDRYLCISKDGKNRIVPEGFIYEVIK